MTICQQSTQAGSALQLYVYVCSSAVLRMLVYASSHLACVGTQGTLPAGSEAGPGLGR